MSVRDEWVYVRHMLDAIHRIERYAHAVEQAQFRSDELLQDAVVRQLEILGEAAGQLSTETCSAHPDIPWALITGMRHRLIHDYFEVDLDLVWRVVAVELVDLKPRIVAMLKVLPREL